mmetsp:Transcript_3850/g.5831  ORF Transcript_3850/g.5831 Transcript_3850/m.5831 type:complete len:108 (+) Transcript_3850:2709-3032(+)
MQFFRWIFYGLFHAIVIYFTCLFFIDWPGQNSVDDGKDLGFWVSGHVVFCACIVVVNVEILFKFNNFTGWGEGLVFGMILTFFTVCFGEGFFSMFPQLYRIFDTMFT